MRNILERAAILCHGGLITAEYLPLTPPLAPKPAPRDVPSDVPPAPAAAPAGTGDLNDMERAMLADALRNARFNKSKAAASLGLTRAQL